MRPLRLRMKAFGPYAGTQDVDFGALSQASLFLIHGPTGGGKTTIFDGMVYALYGTTSGLREGREMRCQYAERTELTEVNFEFSLGTKLYRVRRTPPQTRPKKRGGGETRADAEAEIWDTTGAEEGEEGALLARRPEQVRQKVEELLGFKDDQFRQVVLLPQGKFEELLTAKSDSREAILKILFETGVFERIQKKLSEKILGIRKAFEALKIRKDQILKSHEVEKPEDLEAKLEDGVKGLDALKSKEKTLKEKLGKAGEAYTKARERSQLFKDLDAALAEKRELDGGRSAIELKRREFDAAERAGKLTDLDAKLSEDRKDLKERDAEAAQAKRAFEDAKGELERSKIAEKAAKERQPEIKELQKELGKLESLRPRVKKLGELEGETEKWKDKARELADREGALKREGEDLERKSEKAADDLGTAKTKAAGLPGAKLALKQAKQALKAREKLSEIEAELKTAKKDHAEARRSADESGRKVKAAEEKHERAEKLWTASSASNLSAKLKRGEPCPVCGSKDHPSPAHGRPAAGKMSDHELERIRGECKRAQDAHKRLEDAARKEHVRVEKLEGQAENLKASDEGVDRSLVALRGAAGAAEADVMTCENAGKSVAKLDSSLRELKAAAKKSKGELEKCSKARQSAEKEAGAAKKLLEKELGAIPRNLQSGKALEMEIARVEGKVEELKEKLDRAVERAQAASKALGEAKGNEAQGRKAAERAKSVFSSTEKIFRERLKAAKFGSEAAFRKALRDKAVVAGLKDALEAFKKREAANAAALAKAEKKTKELKRPDLTGAEKARDDAQREHRKAGDDLATLKSELGRMKGGLKEIAKHDEEIEAKDKLMKVYSRMERASVGVNSKRMNLQRYVLAVLLDQVTIAASERLRDMTQGRYELSRREDPSDLRFAGGLELDVLDSYSGEKRGVATLSGGEKFLAALSLALGLADVVQARSGGIRLDSIFVDEGFGSLDTEALDRAIATLVSLKKGGRMVGVISHVADLKERIPARIEVRKGKKGSVVVVAA